ncbi:hypothetical protein G3N58_05395 [Paraburkholderia sp. Ac-20342]|uniref:hypothetical protein n=1 Tax=Paraburkholderia sp. Ac-20342 TaxID=2703889 RepID=UPI00197EEE6A|nr:hypothetical protein [Paraburkholderia sp. Ac-20342]MBN3846268.1 hypothetical protein [Paraburkholderia sp. Ac-20342]
MLLLAFGLAFYTLGASVIKGFVNYRTWHLVSDEHFRDYHRAIGPRIITCLVAPFGVGILLTATLVMWRPLAIPLWPILASLALDGAAIGITLGWQLPTQRRFDRDGWSDMAIAQLIGVERFRFMPHVLNTLLLLWLMGRLLAGQRGLAS